jgi:hypothetical protein
MLNEDILKVNNGEFAGPKQLQIASYCSEFTWLLITLFYPIGYPIRQVLLCVYVCENLHFDQAALLQSFAGLPARTRNVISVFSG